MDSHLHTGTSSRRYLLDQPGVSLEHKLLALMTGFTGPEVLLAGRLLNWEENLDADVTRTLPDRGPEQLLAGSIKSTTRSSRSWQHRNLVTQSAKYLLTWSDSMRVMPQLETDRLLIRPFMETDVADVHAVLDSIDLLDQGETPDQQLSSTQQYVRWGSLN